MEPVKCFHAREQENKQYPLLLLYLMWNSTFLKESWVIFIASLELKVFVLKDIKKIKIKRTMHWTSPNAVISSTRSPQRCHYIHLSQHQSCELQYLVI